MQYILHLVPINSVFLIFRLPKLNAEIIIKYSLLRVLENNCKYTNGQHLPYNAICRHN